MVKTVAIAGASDVAKYVVEELRKEGKHKVVVLSRAVCSVTNCWIYILISTLGA